MIGAMRILSLLLLATTVLSAQSGLHVDTPMTPPDWALMERALLDANSDAVVEFADKYIDESGYLLHTPRWGTLDGPDDAIETYYNWTLLHALGGSDGVLDAYKRGFEGHLKQYGELRTELTDLSANGSYHQEFITQSDWFHTAEGMRGFFLWGLSEPGNQQYVNRMERFAAMYTGENPEIPNYDPEQKVIRSFWTGSLGPMMQDATIYDWVGDPVPGKFHLLHNPARTSKMLDLEEWYPRMLAHCTEYLDTAGDTFLNMAATLLSVNAYALTGNEKYRDWTLEYMDAWKERTEANGGMVPSNVGLDGSLGGEHDGQWWKGTYGWNFTIFDGELDQIADRNYWHVSIFAGFSNALLLTGDQSYIDVLRKQLDLFYDNKKVVDGKTLLPQMYGDPTGYQGDGEPEWYRWTDNLFVDRLTEVYLWSMKRSDLDRIRTDEGWVGFLEGNNPEYPMTAMQADMEHIRERMEKVRTDQTTADTRLADYLLGLVPSTTNTLTELTTGGFFSRGRVWVLHSRLRYFDPEERRSGLPQDVAALVEKMTDDSVVVSLVNTNQVEARTVDVQAGGYAEHQFTGVTWDGGEKDLDSNVLTVRLEPGSGTKLTFTMKRYANQPSLVQPWNRAWMAR